MRFVCLILTLLLISACAPVTARVQVNGLAASGGVAPGTYWLLPLNSSVDRRDLQYQEFKTYAKRVLSLHDMTLVDDNTRPDYVIFFGYGIGAPQKNQVTYSIPNWGQTGVSSAHTSGIITGNGNLATYSGTTTFQPTYGITGYTTGVYEYTTFTRYLRFDALSGADWFKDKSQRTLFKTDIVSEGSTGDLRTMVPILLTAAAPYVSKNTGQEIAVDIAMNDGSINIIRGIPSAYLWRAAMAAFAAPFTIEHSNEATGVIKTAWWTPPDAPNSRIRYSVEVSRSEQGPEAIQVSMFGEVKAQSGSWSRIDVDPSFAKRVKLAVLRDAARMMAAQTGR